LFSSKCRFRCVEMNDYFLAKGAKHPRVIRPDYRP
jgi:hypothetical protein